MESDLLHFRARALERLSQIVGDRARKVMYRFNNTLRALQKLLDSDCQVGGPQGTGGSMIVILLLQ